MEKIPSFYYTPSGELTWNKWLYNIATECLYLPYFHNYSHFDQVDATNLQSKRVEHLPYNSWKDYAFPLLKVILAATVIAPLICHWLAHPTAKETSWQQLKKQYAELPDSEKSRFFYAILTRSEPSNQESASFRSLVALATGHLPPNSRVEEHTSLLERLAPATTGQHASSWAHIMAEKVKTNPLPPDVEATLSGWISQRLIKEEVFVQFHGSTPIEEQTHLLYSCLSAQTQLQLLGELSTRMANHPRPGGQGIATIALKLLPHSVRSAQSAPVDFLAAILPLTMNIREEIAYQFSGLRPLSLNGMSLNTQPFLAGMRQLTEQLPKSNLVCLFWKVASEGNARREEEGSRLVFTTDMGISSPEVSTQMEDFSKMMALEELTGQPWMNGWYSAYQGRSDKGCEQLKQAFALLPNELDLSIHFDQIRICYSRREFLEKLTLSDLTRLVRSDPNLEWLQSTFGSVTMSWKASPPEGLPCSPAEEEGAWIITTLEPLEIWSEKILNENDEEKSKRDLLAALDQLKLPTPYQLFYSQILEVALWDFYLPQIHESLEALELDTGQGYTEEQICTSFNELLPSLLGSEEDFLNLQQHRNRLLDILEKLGATTTEPPLGLLAQINSIETDSTEDESDGSNEEAEAYALGLGLGIQFT